MYTVIGTALNVVMTIAAAYPLSRQDFKGRNAFTVLIVFTMFFSGGMIPTYLLIKDLGLLDSFWVMILPTAVSVWNILIMRTFFQSSIPKELQEAAFLDGCSNLKLLVRIILPLSGPVLAVMVLFYAVGHWNSYFNALIYLSDRDKYPLQLFLREILIQDQMQNMVDLGSDTYSKSLMEVEAIKYAAVMVTNLPMLILYPFLQKYFIKGVMIGAIKG